jgi:hypothetical protein
MKLFSKKNKENKSIQSFSEENVLSFNELSLVRGGTDSDEELSSGTIDE